MEYFCYVKYTYNVYVNKLISKHVSSVETQSVFTNLRKPFNMTWHPLRKNTNVDYTFMSKPKWLLIQLYTRRYNVEITSPSFYK